VPQVSIANKALGNIRAAASQIGLSPSDRGRIQVPGIDDNRDDIDMFLSK
jgi:phage terminase small subunit